MNKAISPKIVALTFGVSVICFAVAFYVIAWQEPTQAPPGGNVPTPINVGPTGQSKVGGLILNTGDATHDPAPNGLVVEKGNLCLGTDCRDSWPTVGETSLPIATPIDSIKIGIASHTENIYMPTTETTMKDYGIITIQERKGGSTDQFITFTCNAFVQGGGRSDGSNYEYAFCYLYQDGGKVASIGFNPWGNDNVSGSASFGTTGGNHTYRVTAKCCCYGCGTTSSCSPCKSASQGGSYYKGNTLEYFERYHKFKIE